MTLLPLFFRLSKNLKPKTSRASVVAIVSILILLSSSAYSQTNNVTRAYAQQYHWTGIVGSLPSITSLQIKKSNTHGNINSTLSVIGTATTKVKPDKVTIILGVETNNKTVTEALAANSATINRMLQVLLAAGVKQNETSTSAFTISPNYNNSKSGETGNITGFTVTNSIQIESNNINNTAKWIDAAVSTLGGERPGGAITVNSVDFTLSDKKLENVKNSLIRQAIYNAQITANNATSVLGLKKLGIKSINIINGFDQPQALLQKDSLTLSQAGSNLTPIIPGQQHGSVSISIIFFVG